MSKIVKENDTSTGLVRSAVFEVVKGDANVFEAPKDDKTPEEHKLKDLSTIARMNRLQKKSLLHETENQSADIEAESVSYSSAADQARIAECEARIAGLEAENAELSRTIETERVQAERDIHQAREQGLKEGLQKRESFERMLQDRYVSAIQTFELMNATLRDMARHEALELGIVLARRIIQNEVQTNPQQLIDMVKRAMNSAVGKNELSIRLNPEDHQRVAQAFGDVTPQFSGIAAVYLVPDAAIEQGGCMVETDMEKIDLSLGRQLSQMKKAIEEEEV